MAVPPKLTGEQAYAGDGYDLVVKIANTSVGTKTFVAQARKSRTSTGTPLATFEVTATDGTGGDAGKVVVTLHLDGTVVATLPSVVHCDLQQSQAGTDPLTLLQWSLYVQHDVTR